MEVENHLNWTEGLINAIDYIETHLIDGEVLDQNTIARQAYSSPDNFRKVFHLITGYTIGEYIRNRRLSLAGEELISSNRTVTDIALDTDMTHPKASRRLSHAFMETLQLMFEITSPVSIISPGLY